MPVTITATGPTALRSFVFPDQNAKIFTDVQSPIPVSDSALDLGSAANRWREVFGKAFTIFGATSGSLSLTSEATGMFCRLTGAGGGAGISFVAGNVGSGASRNFGFLTNYTAYGMFELMISSTSGGTPVGAATIQNWTAAGTNIFGMVNGPTQPRASVFANGIQTIPNAAFTLLPFDSEDYDVGAMHNPAVNPSRVTIPSGGDGVYLIVAYVITNVGTVGQRAMQLYKNGVAWGSTIVGVPNAWYQTTLQTHAVAACVAGDYFEVAVYQDSGGSLASGSAAGARTVQNNLQVAKLW